MAVVIFALGIKSTNGLVKSTINTANALVNNNVDTTIINTIGINGGLEFLDNAFPLDKRVKKYSLDAMYLNKANNITLKQNLFYSIKQKFLNVKYTNYHKEILREIDKNLTENDLIIFVHPLLMQIYIKANPLSKVKKLVQVHGNYIEEKDNFNLLEGYYEKLDYIQTVSRLMMDDMINKLGSPSDKTIYIPNITTPIKIVKNKEKYIKRVSIVGSIQERKNQFDAVRMLSCIEDNNVVLQIIGNTLQKKYIDKIKSYIIRKNLKHRVLFLGVLSEREIYENSDILILPSRHEGFGYTFLECALYDIPTVAYKFDYGSKEFLSHVEDACLVEQGDFKSLARKVSRILENDSLRKHITTLNKDKFEKQYKENLICNQYIGLLNDKTSALSLNNLHCKNDTSLIFTDLKRTTDGNYYNFTVNATGNVDGVSLMFYYKKRKSYIKYIKGNIDITTNTTQLHFKIPRRNILSLGSIIKGFYIAAEDVNNYEYYIGFISLKENYEEVFNNKQYYIKHTNNQKITDTPTFMDKSGLYIRYPSPEAIVTITNEYGDVLPYETKLLNINDIYEPYFKIKSGLYNYIKIQMNSGFSSSVYFDDFSYTGTFNKLKYIENKYHLYDLYDLNVAGIHFWELIRVELLEHILVGTGVLDSDFTNNIYKKPYIYNGDKSLFNIPKGSSVVFEFPRKKEVDHRTQHINSSLSSTVFIEYPQEDGYSDNSYNLNSNVYPIEEFIEFKNNEKIKYTSEDRMVINNLRKVFHDELGLDINIFAFIDGRLKKYKREYNFFNKLFSDISPKEVIIPSSYWSAGIISAAKNHSILTSDIQYALISSFHPSFSFPKDARYYAADRIYIWSDYWKIDDAPYSQYRINQDNYFMQKCKSFKLSRNSNKFDVCFISQSRIGRDLLRIAYSFALKNKDLSIAYCAHPNEDITIYDQYIDFLALNNVSTPNDDTLLTVDISRNVVGVYSTTMIEALALGKRVYIAALSGHRIMNREISSCYFTLFDGADELGVKLLDDPLEHKIDFCRLFYNFSLSDINDTTLNCESDIESKLVLI